MMSQVVLNAADATVLLRRREDRASQAISVTLSRHLSGHTSTAELSWLEKIEVLRTAVAESREELEIVDYGAGTPEIHLTAAEMNEGRVVRRTVGDLCSSASVGPPWSSLLFGLVRAFKPQQCLELGTCLGLSACFQGAALAVNRRGRLVTLEGSAALASLATSHLRSLCLTGVSVVQGRFQDTLAEVLRANGPVDYAFIDGHHDRDATLGYFDLIWRHRAGTLLLVMDDIGWSSGMRQAWTTMRHDRRVALAVELGRFGLCVIDGAVSDRVDLSITF